MTALATTIRAATALLTRLPVASAGVATAGAAAFPIVGSALGVLAAIPILVLGPLEPVIAAIAALAVGAIVTGGLHLDGLADTTDALMAPDAMRAEEARRDPRVGSGGVIALVLVISAEVAALVSLLGSVPIAVVAAVVIVAGAGSRLLPVLVAALERPADEALATAGSGAWFARQVRLTDVVAATALALAITVVVSLIVGSWLPAVAGAAGVALGLGASAAIRHARGRLDGDGLGASVEVTTVLTLVAAAIGG